MVINIDFPVMKMQAVPFLKGIFALHEMGMGWIGYLVFIVIFLVLLYLLFKYLI